MRRPESSPRSLFAHETAIQAEAGPILLDLGLTRVGQSRDWLLDFGYAFVVLSFRSKRPIDSLRIPRKAWASAGVAFLWNERATLATTIEMPSVGTPIPFYDEEDWQAPIAKVVDQATALVKEARQELGSVEAAAAFLLGVEGSSFYLRLDRAIAAGLAGDPAAIQAFNEVQTFGSEAVWVEDEKERAARLAKLLPQRAAFAEAVEKTIAISRRNLRLENLTT